MSTLSCSLNVNNNAFQHNSVKFNNIQNIEYSPRIVMEKKYSTDRVNNLMSIIEKKEIVGKGGFGKVWRVELRGTKKYLALKEMSKALYK